LVIFWIDLVFSQATWLTSAVNRAISAETSASSSAAAALAGCFAIVAVFERSATDIGGNSSVFVRMSIFCGSARLKRQRVGLLCRGSWLTIGLCFRALRVVLPEQVASSLCK
jgi:hypothetical protein